MENYPLFSFYNVPSYNTSYDFAIDRFNVIFHTRLRLETYALNYFLYKIGCKGSPVCFCGFYNETIEHFLLECPLYPAPRINLLFSAARIFADMWFFMSKSQKVSVFLFGSSYFLLSKIMIYFFHVQSFTSESKRFYKST